MKITHKRFIIVALVVVILSIPVLFYVNTLRLDKNKFDINQHKTEVYLSNISNTKTQLTKRTNYCSRNHMQYSRGTLGCIFQLDYMINSSQKTETNLVNQIFDNVASSLNWKPNGSNTQSLKEGTGEDIVRGETYRVENLGCSIYLARNADSSYHISAGCDGPAKHAWYPVKS